MDISEFFGVLELFVKFWYMYDVIFLLKYPTSWHFCLQMSYNVIIDDVFVHFKAYNTLDLAIRTDLGSVKVFSHYNVIAKIHDIKKLIL